MESTFIVKSHPQKMPEIVRVPHLGDAFKKETETDYMHSPLPQKFILEAFAVL